MVKDALLAVNPSMEASGWHPCQQELAYFNQYGLAGYVIALDYKQNRSVVELNAQQLQK
ncbi:hypothetical protein [Moritella sp.]|uniref:hypothetical protein n=1 Tax=Moritella sp. TaxID=78556 RepID=UPI001E151E8A|nr:hypothetical protein [Moritella sp.]MCJ8350476.1 hypothetical protein [Moritella sp.]NQZ42618.1 hypothetical protein [Moritella sp.]